MWEDLMNLIGAESPLRYILLTIVALYFVVLATGNLRKTFIEMQGRRQQLELLKLELEILKLRHDLELSDISHERVEDVAREAGASLEAPERLQSSWSMPVTVVYGIFGVLLAIFSGALAIIALLGGYPEGDYGAATVVLVIGVGGIVAGVQIVRTALRRRR